MNKKKFDLTIFLEILLIILLAIFSWINVNYFNKITRNLERWYEYIYTNNEHFRLVEIMWASFYQDNDTEYPISVCVNKDVFDCLDLDIRWAEKVWENIYLYINKTYSIKENEKWEIYYYPSYFWEKYKSTEIKFIAKNISEIPDLIKLSDKIEYFNSKDFEWVSEKDKEIFEKIIAEASTEGFNLIDKIIEYKNLNK